MRGYDVIRALYQGDLRPCDRGFRPDTDFSITMDAFTKHEKWLRNSLEGEAGKRFEELISCHNDIIHTMSYEISVQLSAWRDDGDGGRRRERSYLL